MNMSNNMADLETNKRYEAFGFSIGNRGYVGTGFSGAGNSYSDFWEYNPADNTWSKKDDFPGGPRQYSFTFVIGGKGYVGGGYTGNTLNVFKDFYEYNPLTGHWTTKDSIPIPISYATAFSINDKGYVATGNKNGAASQDVYEYNSQTDTWAQKNIFPGNARFGASSFSIGEKGYLGFGTNGGSSFGDIYNDFWEYNPINDVWVQRITPPVPAAARFYAVGFSIGNSGYIGTGHTTTSDLLSDFWTFVP
jgi:N-acetylneuraminic acid mutarotase